ncbi:MAG: T9SS type A sorting domain-containing protein [Bacteroidetes bacterium]|nr:T9SS type A sorting domain-containing protein [Bacteroidota bacterium]
MKKNYIFFPLLLFIFPVSDFAQAPLIMWVNGSDTTDQEGTYGVQGIASGTNIPGARENSMSWTDSDNNLWLFGGHGYTTTGAQGYLSDLWKFDPVTAQWTWISGSTTLNEHGVYGSLGVAGAGNYPGARQNACTWVDGTGNLWLFGGYGYAIAGPLDYLNDLWKYDLATGQWTWVSGSSVIGQPGNYGTQGISSASNVPGSRYGGNAWYTTNTLWLFGGQGFSTAQERYNDLWKYDLTSGQWTWISGSDLPDQNGVYGIMGTSSGSNCPGARQASAAWLDNTGNFWVYGGYGFPETGTHNYLNDLWKYDLSLNEWVWISGSNTTNQVAAYGTQNVSSPSNNPGARQMSVSWKSSTGELWLFSAWGHTGFTGGASFGRINDLWKYNIAVNEWTWVGGSDMPDQAGVYGTAGIAAETNIPGSRRMSVCWTDSAGNFWLFGGNGYDKNGTLGLLNDLWKITVESTAALPENGTASFDTYPLPFVDRLVVEFADDQVHQVEITDLSGRVVFYQSVSGMAILDMTTVPAGIYIVRSGQQVKKILKTN